MAAHANPATETMAAKLSSRRNSPFISAPPLIAAAAAADRWRPMCCNVGTDSAFHDISAQRPGGCTRSDCETGRELAREYLAYIGQYSTVCNATLLGCIVNDTFNSLSDRGRLSGIEIAFLAGVNRAAMTLAAYVPPAVAP